MATEPQPLQNFNTETMSGIYPGSRTMVYQRIRLWGSKVHGRWHQLRWYTSQDNSPQENGEADVAILQAGQVEADEAPLTITIAAPRQADFILRLHKELAAAGLQADACYTCRYWQALAVETVDGLPAGRCRWSDAASALPSALATQSALSLSCEHLQRLEHPQTVDAETSGPGGVHPQVPKSAELDPDRLPFWPRLWHRLRRNLQPAYNWADQIIERSGVGAGTEPCFACQGRLANLGALAVASPEGDKQTFSVWRCRNCYTTYFNDWIDRWERLENLETEERYYRIAPAEAYHALQIIYATAGGEHPGHRHNRAQERSQMLALIEDKQPLSHQIRQGR